jgi:hypothetical protein
VIVFAGLNTGEKAECCGGMLSQKHIQVHEYFSIYLSMRALLDLRAVCGKIQK